MEQTDSAKIRRAGWRYAITLVGVIAVAGYVLYHYWTPDVLTGETSPATTNPKAAAERARNLEVIKVCLQVIGIGVISAILGFAATRIEALRREHREGFEIRTELLDRSTRCAHIMYVACQHHVRMTTGPKATTTTRRAFSWLRQPADAEPLDTLHDAYRTFASEASAIQALIGARYTDDRGKKAASQRAGFWWDERPDAEVGESWWRWHQLYDLLTVYYFSLLKDFRDNDKVLTNNALGHEHEYHSGLAFDEIKKDAPSARLKASPPPRDNLMELWAGDKYDRIPRFVRHEFDRALPRFVDALRIDIPRKER